MGISIIGLFAACSATVGFRAVLWGLGIFHLIGALGVLALWWWEEHQGSKAAWKEDPEVGALVPRVLPAAGQLILPRTPHP